jgi:hypothetical protein
VKIRKSKSGYYKVELARTVSVAGFDYKPGQSHVVNQVTLDAMIAEEGAVTNVLPSE